MVKLFLLIIIANLLGVYVSGQTVDELVKTAQDYAKKGDYNNAIIVYRNALEQQPDDVNIRKELAISFYSISDFPEALKVIKPTLSRKDNDEGCFLVAANIEEQINGPKEAEKTYKKGLKAHPTSGQLYYRYGRILNAQQDVFNALKQFEKGIEMEPDFGPNYFEAGRIHILSKTENAWGLIYMEQFLNVDPRSVGAGEAKDLLMLGYKKLFGNSNPSDPKFTNKSDFSKSFLQVLGTQSSIMIQGVTVESLTILRSRFVLDWFKRYAPKYEFKLFDEWRYMMRNGIFEAYNYWVFYGDNENVQYKNWQANNPRQYKEFRNFISSRTLKPLANQYYNIVK